MKNEPCRNKWCKSYHPKAIAYCPTCRNTATRANEEVARAVFGRKEGKR